MLRRFAVGGTAVLPRRALSASSTAATTAAGKKDAVRPDADPKFRGRLDKIARPFAALLSNYNAKSGTEGQGKSVAGLGFGLTAADLSASKIPDRISPTIKQIVALDMCSQSELKRTQVHQAMQQFCRAPNDTGSPEVQAAIWSVKIAALEAHVRQYRHDYVAERKIVEFKDQRRKILRYLKRVSLSRYYECLDRLGLPHNLVEAAISRFPAKPVKRPKTKEGLRKLQTRRK